MCLFSKALFDSSVWPLLSDHESAVVHAHVMRLYHSFLPTDAYVPDVDFLVSNSLVPPCAMVSLSRLSLFSRLLRCGHFSVLSLLFAGAKRPKAWLNAITSDLQYLTTTPEFKTATTWSVARWADYIRQYPQQFITAARTVYMMPFTVLRYVPQHINDKKVDTNMVSTSFKCSSCLFTTSPKQQLQLHMFKAHACIHPLQMYITPHETIYPICLTQFHTRVRLLEHLR